jgi:type IV pilus assembly protein PilM
MRTSTTLGINISNDQISAALLTQTAQGIEVLKSAAAPVPEGATANGCVKNPLMLAKAVKELCSRNNMPTGNAVVSLMAKPAILRVMEMPRDLTTNPAQYIHNELKHYAVMSGKTIMHDYCPLASPKKSTAARLLLAATDEEKVDELAKAFNRTGITIKAFEPAAIAYIRLLHTNAIAKKFNSNVLIAVVQDTVTTLCVFRDTNLDFVHTVEIGRQNLDNETDIHTLATEIGSIAQFYDVEVAEASKQWEVILAFSSEHAQQDRVRQSIQNGLAGMNVRISSPATVRKDAPLTVKDDNGTVSPISAGLAMKYFKTGIADLKINLLPAATHDSYNMKKFALTAASIAIIVFLLSLSAIPIVRAKLNKVTQTIEKRHAAMLSENMTRLLKKDAALAQKNKALNDRLQAMNAIISGSVARNWPRLLQDIGSRIPQNTRITGLTAKDTSLRLTGQAISYAQITNFVELLGKSPYIASATLAKSEIDPLAHNVLQYDITCTFTAGEVEKHVN